jgi:Alpha-L-fucosidase
MIIADDRMKWFREARFGVVVHFGLYSLLERGEWTMFNECIPAEEYRLLADKLEVDKDFSVRDWVDIAKEAGAKYMVFTARHHDGFCLFDSAASDFTSVKTSAKRDFVSEYCEECRKVGMKVGIYYSLLDWRFKGYFDRSAFPESYKAMVKQAKVQLRELMSNYGKIDYLWFDGAWFPDAYKYWETDKEGKLIAGLWNSVEIVGIVRGLQPYIIINNRSGLPEDVDTPEQHVTKSDNGRMWESCMTIGDSNGWGYIRHNPNMKSTHQLIQHLVTASSGEGNFLLNIGPYANGKVREEEKMRLKEMGKWLKVNGDSIYAAKKCPDNLCSNGMRNLVVPGGTLGNVTVKDNKAFIHVFRWPGQEAYMPGVGKGLKSVYLLSSKKEYSFKYCNNGRLIIYGLPENPPDPYDSVIALEFDRELTGYDTDMLKITSL